MKFEEIKQACPIFAQNYPSDISISLFGRTARRHEMNEETDEDSDSDIDLLFMVHEKTFFEFQKDCYMQGVNFADGNPLDPMDYYWQYFSSQEIRFNAAFRVLGVFASLQEQLFQAFQGQILDILLLPFDWQDNEEILELLNHRDPKFSENISKDARLLFEKKTTQKIN